MKKYILLIIPLLMAAILLSGCGKSNVEGTWKKEEAGAVDKGYDSDEFVFHKNGEFDYSVSGATTNEGKYTAKNDSIKLKGKSNTFTVKLKDGKKFKYHGKVYKKQKG
jgi:major membrane immunogen (membrane-anchored lipoprotein)